MDALETVGVMVGRLAAHADEDVVDLPLVGLQDGAGQVAGAVLLAAVIVLKTFAL